MKNLFLPVSIDDMRRRGWDEIDVVIVTGDAYVDHPSCGAAMIGRYLESKGYRTGIIAQPDWKNKNDFMRLGRPRLFFGITSGGVDSMIANYTAKKIPRRTDDYSPASGSRGRPDRALIVYSNKAREAYKNVAVVIGGMEASLRRLAHYDYWADSVRRSVLADSKADILVYGMGEAQIAEIARRMDAGESPLSMDGISGTVVMRKEMPCSGRCIELPSYEKVSRDKNSFNAAFRLFYGNLDPASAAALAQRHGDRYALQFPPPEPPETKFLDELYGLPFARRPHPSYDKAGGVKGFETVRYSIISHRGCPGECSFCSLYAHQGRIVRRRSRKSILKEAALLRDQPYFRGTITDIGGPTANLYGASCAVWEKGGVCSGKKCLGRKKCPNLKLGYGEFLSLLRDVRSMEGVKHAFIGSGFRCDLFEGEGGRKLLKELCRHHISGRMKVAPEHVVDGVLKVMNKPGPDSYESFREAFDRVNPPEAKKVFLVNYFISGHPGSTLRDALEMALYFMKHRMHPEQVQDFIPLPMTLSAAMYHTGKDPFTGRDVYVPKSYREREMQRALIQYRNPGSRAPVIEALRQLGEERLIKRFFPK